MIQVNIFCSSTVIFHSFNILLSISSSTVTDTLILSTFCEHLTVKLFNKTREFYTKHGLLLNHRYGQLVILNASLFTQIKSAYHFYEYIVRMFSDYISEIYFYISLYINLKKVPCRPWLQLVRYNYSGFFYWY